MPDVNTVITENGTEVYENGIYLYLDQYIADHNVEDMHKEPQSRWNAALLYINKNLFKLHPEILKSENRVSNTYDINIIKDVKTCGVGYRLILPKKIKTGVSVFDLLVLNPMNTFVVYSNDAYREPILGVSYFPHRDGSVTFGCYTKTSYFKIEMGITKGFEDWFEEKPNTVGMVPIIEYINDYDRMGCFERVIPLMDALNTIDSDRVNDIAQHIQNILWGDNVAIDTEQYKELRKQGLILTKSEQGRTATLKYLESVLNQSENQTLVDYVKQQILDITNTPSRSELSGGSTGSATNMSTGYVDVYKKWENFVVKGSEE